MRSIGTFASFQAPDDGVREKQQDPTQEAATMRQTASNPHRSERNDETESDQIEWELSRSDREASFGVIPFANLDLTRLVRQTRGRQRNQGGTSPVRGPATG